MPFKSLTISEFKNKIYTIVGNEYSVVSGFKRMDSICKFKHNVCGTLFETTPNNFIYKNGRCKKCRDNKLAKSPKKFEQEFYKLEPINYKLIGTYTRSTIPVKVKHLSCGNEYMVTPKEFLRGRRCPKCYGNPRKTTEEFYSEVRDLTLGEYELLSEYKNNREDVTIKHLKCGNTYIVRPHDFLEGNRCPFCRESRGEKLIEYTLKQLEQKYTRQKYFKECKRANQVKNSYLRFDFYLPSYNVLIEYDGEQHFHPIVWFGGEDKFKDQQERDNIKNKFAQENGIELVRYPYTISDKVLVDSIKKLINNCKAEGLIPKLESKI